MKKILKSIGRHVHIENGIAMVDKVEDNMLKAEEFKDLLIYDNLSDDALATDFSFGVIMATNKRAVDSMLDLNPNADKIRKSYVSYCMDIQNRYGKSIDAIVKSYLDHYPMSISRADIVNRVLTNVKVEVDSDLMGIAFLLGDYITRLTTN